DVVLEVLAEEDLAGLLLGADPVDPALTRRRPAGDLRDHHCRGAMVVVDDLTFGGAGPRVPDVVEAPQLPRVPVDLELRSAGRHGARVPQLRREVTDRSVEGRAGGPEGTGPGSPGDFCT